jgi:cell division protein FtsZ
MTLFEVDEAANRIREEVDPDANIIFGSTFDEKLAGKMRISVVATGIEAELAPEQARSAHGGRSADSEPSLRDSGSAYTQPILTQNAATPPTAGDIRGEPPRLDSHAPSPAEPVPPAAEAAESAALLGGAFIAPRPVDPGPARPMPVTQPAIAQPSSAAAGPAAPGNALPRPKGRVPSLIERVTGVGRARPPAPPSVPAPDRSPRPAAAPARPAQARLTPLEPEERPGTSKEDDLLDIPAFLRRQAN